MQSFAFVSLLLVVAAAFGFANAKLLRLPHTIGMLVLALVASLVLLAVNHALGGGLAAPARGILASMDLPRIFLDGALGFLLFAAALHVDLAALLARRWEVLSLATVGVVLAAVLFAIGISAVFRAVGVIVPLSWCLVLGAILAPTDPVAVSDMLRRVGLPSDLRALVAAESLFNDGVGIILFLLALGVAGGEATASGSRLAASFLVQAGGGALLGLATGGIACLALRRLGDAKLEVTITLALAAATFSLARGIGASGPIAVVTAGILVGNRAPSSALADFWGLADELLNAILFLLIGFEVLALDPESRTLIAALTAVPLAIVVRLISVVLPTYLLPLRQSNRAGTVAVLTWGGLRGGLSIAMALTLPETPYRGALLVVAYAIVVFTILVQGMTMPLLLRRLFPATES